MTIHRLNKPSICAMTLMISVCLVGCQLGSSTLQMVPDLRGKSQEEAMEIIRSKNLKADFVEGGFFPTTPAGYVVTQNPYPMTKVKKGRTIQLFVSQGATKVTVPSLINQNYGKAAETLKTMGLFLGEITEVHDNQAVPGTILSQNPRQDSEVLSGSAVNVSVSVPGLPSVPNLLDIPFEDAKHMIESSGYKLGSVLFIPNPNHARGVVYQQEPIPESPAQVGTIVNIIVNEKP
ncbi:PASTA domain-containing protein [bacterium]|nr:PASTA domain-containing protein [bacterium]